MELSQLAAKQKRARDWQRFIEAGETSDQAVVTQTKALLTDYRNTLSHAALENVISAATEAKIID